MRTLSIAVIAAIAVLGVGCGDGDEGAEGSPSPQPVTESPAPVAGTGRLQVGDQQYELELDECFASPDNGIRVRGTTEQGHDFIAEYEPPDFDTSRVHITDRDGESVWTSDPDQPPTFETDDNGGFTARGTFTSRGGETHDGFLSGAC